MNGHFLKELDINFQYFIETKIFGTSSNKDLNNFFSKINIFC